MNIFVPVSAIFPDVQADLRTLVSLLRTLSRGDVVMRSARLIHTVTAPPEQQSIANDAFGMAHFFDSQEMERVLRFASEHGQAIPIPFFRGALLELIRWAVLVCEDHPTDGVTFHDSEAHRTFAKVALIANDIWSQHVFDGWASIDVDGDIVGARNRALPAFRKSAESGGTLPCLHHRLGRGWTLFTSLLPALNKTFSARFHSATGLTISEYYACYVALITGFILDKPAAAIFDSTTLGQKTCRPDLVRSFIGLESQTLDELRSALWGDVRFDESFYGLPQNWDLKPIRERPIARLPDGHAIILDPIAVYDKVSIGPLFCTLRARTDQNAARQLFADFGKAFEHFIQQSLRRTFPAPSKELIDRLTCNLEGSSVEGKHEIDACIDFGNDLIVIETKAKWSKEADLVPSAWPSLLQSLRKQYGGEGSESGAALQFARFCRAIAESGRIEPHWDFRHIKQVIPVLVVHDTLVVSPGFGPLLCTEFVKAIGAFVRVRPGEIEVGSTRILMPIVLTVDDIENLESSLEHFSLRAVLLEYSQADPERLMSFHNFIATSAAYSSRLYVNRHLVGSASEPIQNAIQVFFRASASK
ncbi:MAG: hypothetical protein JST16_19160 [Bdellovibrionales bacterium]|nr:hypothetical protein [Bdellovibrionales bacterium]